MFVFLSLNELMNNTSNFLFVKNVKAIFDTAIKVVLQPPRRKEMEKKKRRRSSGRAIALVTSFFYLYVDIFHTSQAQRLLSVNVESATS